MLSPLCGLPLKLTNENCSKRILKGSGNTHIGITLEKWSESVNQKIPAWKASKPIQEVLTLPKEWGSGRRLPRMTSVTSPKQRSGSCPVCVTRGMDALCSHSVPYPLPESWLAGEVEIQEICISPVPLFTHCCALNCAPHTFIC